MTQIARLTAITAAQLQDKSIPPISWAVPGIIPGGLTILAGKPKIGKSWLVLDLAIACAEGGFTLDNRKCQQGDVLYAAMEDGERRLKDRLGKVIPSGAWPENLTLCTELNRLDAGGIDQIRQWIDETSAPRLVIIDTFAKVRSPKGREETLYEADYRSAGVLKNLADETGVAVIIVHHVRKMDAEDPLDSVSGTTGLTGAADTILVLKRGGSDVTMFGRGRDIEEIELAVELQRDTCRWLVLGNASEIRRSAERLAIIDAIREAGGPMMPVQIAAVTGKSPGSVRRMMPKMARDGDLKAVARGKYDLP